MALSAVILTEAAENVSAMGKTRLPTPIDSTSISADSVNPANQNIIYEYLANPVLQILTWPVETFLVPAVNVLIYPTKAPLRYVINENVIDRTIQLISFGEKNQMMIYPTLNLATGTSSNTGLTFRHNSIFSRPTESLVSRLNFYVNGDTRFRTYLTMKNVIGTDFSFKISFALNHIKNYSVRQPGDGGYWYYADTSYVYGAQLSHLLFEKFSATMGTSFRDNLYSESPPQPGNKLTSDFFRNDSGQIDPQLRGLNQAWWDQSMGFGISRDTRSNENIPLSGSNFSFGWAYHYTNAQHDYHGWEMLGTKYFKLGAETYEISPQEERKRGNLSMKKFLENMEYSKLREQIFNRKVIAFHFYAAQSYEVAGNHMPVYGLSTLGNDTPMRGYGGARFRDYASVSTGAEYRFPVMRLVEGVLFDEYGNVGKSIERIDYLGYKNSWGFGIRVRRPDIFLFRTQLGFHGSHGIQLNLSVDAPY